MRTPTFICICGKRTKATGALQNAQGVERRYYCYNEACRRVIKTQESIVNVTYNRRRSQSNAA